MGALKAATRRSHHEPTGRSKQALKPVPTEPDGPRRRRFTPRCVLQAPAVGAPGPGDRPGCVSDQRKEERARLVEAVLRREIPPGRVATGMIAADKGPVARCWAGSCSWDSVVSRGGVVERSRNFSGNRTKSGRVW